MTDERWARVKALFQATVEHPATEREATAPRLAATTYCVAKSSRCWPRIQRRSVSSIGSRSLVRLILPIRLESCGHR
jgi:hypothetical protein